MRFILLKAVLYGSLALGVSSSASADFFDDFVDAGESGLGVATDIVGALSPVTTIADGVNDLTRTVTKTTTVKGEVFTEVHAGQITQEIVSGENSSNDLNLGSVSGGAYVGSSFRADVNVKNITQKLRGANNHNAANIGSVSR